MHVGIHVSANQIPDLPQRYDFSAVQIFTIVPQQIKLVNYDETVLALAARKGLHIWTHSSYLVSPWGSKPYNLPLCVKQLRQNAAFSGQGVVFHIPKVPAKMLVDGLRELIQRKPKGARVVLENKAVRPEPLATYETPEKINGMIETFIRAGIPRREIWLCIDTAHLYCSGQTLRTREDADKWLRGLKYPDRIAAFHLNGNSSRTFSDQHAIAFGPKDLIWGEQAGRALPFAKSGVAAIRDFCRARGIDILLECNFDAERVQALALIARLKNK